MADNALLAALIGGGGGGGGDVASNPFLLAAPEVQLGQQMQQAGLSTAPAYPAQALGRLAQTLAGSVVRNQGISDLAKTYSSTAHDMAQRLRAVDHNNALIPMLESDNPITQIEAVQTFPKVITALGIPGETIPGGQRITGIGPNTNPQSPEGKAFRDAAVLRQMGYPEYADAIERTQSKETFLPQGSSGVQSPNVVRTVPVRNQPGQQAPQSLPTQLGVAEANKNAPASAEKDFNEKSVPAYEAAQKTMKALDLIDQNIAKLGPRWMGMGATEKVAAAKAFNSALDTLGLEHTPHIDPTKISAAEDFQKESTRLGFELAKTLGSREAQMIVQQAISSVPNMENSYLGSKYVSAAVRADAQRTMDQHEYKAGLLRDGKSLVGADVDFNKQHPAKEYAMRAITSQIPAGAITDLKANPKLAEHFDATFGPGTAKYLLELK